MAEIQPFYGIVYNKDKVKNIGQCISLPYDKISPEQLDAYYANSEANIARVILGKDEQGDNETNNRYTRANDYLQKWLEEGILVQEDKPHLYAYEQTFTVPDGRTLNRTAFVALIRLEEFEKMIVRPHEKTLSGPKVDRLNLMNACHMSLGQIFGLYEDDHQTVGQTLANQKQNDPYFDVITEEENIGHKFWKISDPQAIETIQGVLKDRPVYIADGHHRYSTAINYRNEMREKYPEQAQTGLFNYCLMTFVAIDDPGMEVLATHRVLGNLDNFDWNALLPKLETYFDIREVSKVEEAKALEVLSQDGDQKYFW